MFKRIKHWLFGADLTENEKRSLVNNAKTESWCSLPFRSLVKPYHFPNTEWIVRKPTFKKAVKKPSAPKTKNSQKKAKTVAKSPAKPASKTKAPVGPKTVKKAIKAK